nr:uncharacterized protein LOC129165002 [Nothobranchius furzeri]
MEGQSSELTNSQQPGGAAAHDYEPGLLSGQILSKLVAVAREPDYPSRDFTEEQRSDELEAVIDQIENPDGTKPIQVHLAKLALILYQRELQHDREIMKLQSMLAERQQNGRQKDDEEEASTDSGEDGEKTPPPSADDNRQWEGGEHRDSEAEPECSPTPVRKQAGKANQGPPRTIAKDQLVSSTQGSEGPPSRRKGRLPPDTAPYDNQQYVVWDSLDGRTPQGRDEAYLSQPSAPFPTHTIGHSGPSRGRGQFALEPQVGPPPSSSRPSQSVRSRPAERHLYLDRSPSPRRVQGAGWGYAQAQAAPQPSTHPSYSGIRHADNQLHDQASYASPYPDRAYYAEAPVERRRLHFADVPREEDLPRHPRDVPAARHNMPDPDLGPRSQHWEPRAHQRYPAPSETDRGSESEDDAPYRESGLRVRQIESLAKDIERFDPNTNESNVDDYLREIERCLLDLPAPSSREKLKLIWKTTSRTVHGFMETLPPDIRDRYSSLCRALRDEYATYADSASATMGAFSIKHGRNEPPREYYRRLKSAYFQGRNGPGLEEDPAFRSLFIHNLHECVRSEVSMYCRMKKLTTQEIRRYAQQAWEAGGKPQKPDAHHRVMHLAPDAEPRLELEGTEAPPTKPKSAKPRPAKPQKQSQSPQQGKGGADWPPRSGQSDRKWPNQNQRQAGRNSGRFKERRQQVSPERKSAGEYLTKADLQEMLQQFLAKQKEQLRSADETPAPKSSSKKPDPEPTSA